MRNLGAILHASSAGVEVPSEVQAAQKVAWEMIDPENFVADLGSFAVDLASLADQQSGVEVASARLLLKQVA